MDRHENIDFDFTKSNKPFVITVCSGKGGVGKSFLASNISYCISLTNLSTLIWDADNNFPNQHLLLGVEPPVRLQEVLSGKFSIQNAIYPLSDYFCLLAGMPATGVQELYDDSSILLLYNEIIKDSIFDVIVFDSPAGASNNVLQTCELSDIICIVITDEPTSLLDAYALIKILLNKNEPSKIKILVNNVIDSDDADDISLKLNMATEKFLGFKLDVAGFVPYDRIVRQSIVKQELLLKNNLPNEINKSIRTITDKLLEQISVIA